MSAGRRHKTPESETKSTLLLTAITVPEISSRVLVFQTPGHCNKDRVIPADAEGVHCRRGTLSLGNANYFSRD